MPAGPAKALWWLPRRRSGRSTAAWPPRRWWRTCVVSKFCDSLPLYRQSQMLARQGVTLDRSTLSNWVGRACWWLTPLYELLVSTALSAPKLFADDTTLPVLDPGRGRTKTGRLWCYAVDDRPWSGPTHPVAAYVYTEDRKNVRPASHLADFRGVLQVDGYDGFKRLAGNRADASVTLAFCWAHMRRAVLRVPCLDQVAARRRGAGRDRASSTPSRRKSAAIRPSIDGRCARSEVGPSSRLCMLGCRTISGGLRRLGSGQGHALRDPTLAGPDRVP